MIGVMTLRRLRCHLHRLLGPALLICAAALLGAGAWASTYSFAKLKPGVELGDYAYRFVRRGRAKDYVLEATLTTTAKGPGARIVFGYQDQANHYYAEASDTNCLFVKVEDGIERHIGTPSTAQLARNADARLTLIRWRHTMGLWLNGRQVAEAYDGTFRTGRVAIAGRSDSATIGTVRFQVASDVRFSDDFMRTSAEDAAWETVAGAWKLKSLRNASLSANGFMFLGTAADGQGALAVRGYWFWHNYVVSIACCPQSDDAVGLAFYYRGPGDYHLLRWESRNQGGRLQLLRVAGKARHVLGTATVGFNKGQWYQLKVRVIGQRAAAYVDGLPHLHVADPALVSGSIGLYSEGADGALFDDVQVAAPRDVHEDFEHPIKGKWTELGGTWTRRPGTLADAAAPGHHLTASAPAEGRYVSGEEAWSGYTVGVDVVPPTAGSVGLVAHYQDEANFYLLELSPTEALLAKVLEGQRSELARAPAAAAPAKPHRLELTVGRHILTGRLDGRIVVRRADADLRRGRAGLFVRAAKDAGFDDLAVAMPRRRQELFAGHEIFEAETSMAKWAVQQSDWLAVADTLGGRSQSVQWHRADFPADVEVRATIARLAAGGTAWIILGGNGASVAGAYRVRLDRGGDGCLVAIERGAKQVAQRKLKVAGSPKLLSAERIGHAIVAHVDGKVALTYEDPSPLPGRRIAWAGHGCTLAKNGIDLFSRSVLVYAFHKAPVDWRPVSGHWEVTNRWQCDPRWSFFAGEQTDSHLVALWNKRDFGSDVTLEFAAGIRHDPNKGGTDYSYASDINAVLCGDGVDLRNGYNVVFAGWHNKHTRILRNGKVVADTTKFLMHGSSTQHRYWFYIKIQKHGGRIRLFIDNALALEYNDPTPLGGRKLALWTWNNDLMVARVRVSTRHAAPCEPPAPPAAAKPACIYR